MNISALEHDPDAFQQWRNAAFPFFHHQIMLNHAAIVPIPQVVSDAICAHAHKSATRGQAYFLNNEVLDRCRQRAAALLNPQGSASEIAFAGSTSHALGIVATSIDWKPGDNCVIADGDFPANVVTWLNLKIKYGVEVRMIPRRENFEVTLEDVQPFVDERTRIVSLSSANFLSGALIDTATIGAWLHEKNVLFCVDAIQTLGALPLDVSHVDFVCADGHKWLLGPSGAAILWTRQSVLETLRPAMLGWLASPNMENVFAYSTDPFPNGQRFEPGERNAVGIAGLDAALGLLAEIGTETIAQRVRDLRAYSIEKLQQIGCRVLFAGEHGSGSVSFQIVGDIRALHEHLEKRFAISLRHDFAGDLWIRSSAHGMNTRADIDELADAVKKLM